MAIQILNQLTEMNSFPYIEPVYMNEKMVLNCAAYVFKGVALESETAETNSSKNKGKLSLGFKFLQDLVSPISANAEHQKERSVATKTARRYTLGGLHMTLIDTLRDSEEIIIPSSIKGFDSKGKFVELDVILKPIDFYSIIETLKIASPLISQIMVNFGDKFNAKIFTKELKGNLAKYETLLTNILKELETDYLKSGQLEMLMIDPKTNKQIGLVDIDVADVEAISVKAKLTDGQFRVIGRVSRIVNEKETISLVQRTVLSSIIEIVGKVAAQGTGLENYKQTMESAKVIAQQFCQLSLQGPAVRVMAMSVCI